MLNFNVNFEYLIVGWDKSSNIHSYITVTLIGTSDVEWFLFSQCLKVYVK